MKTLLSILAILLPLSALADRSTVMRNDDGKGNYARLFAVPCANDLILAKTPPEYRPQLQAGETSIDGKVYGMCWMMLQDGSVAMLYDDGDYGRMPASAFRVETNS